MARRLSNPAPRHFLNSVTPTVAAGAKMFFFSPGTLTAKDTYSDNGLTTPNTNPLILSASGLQPNVFLSGSYRVVLAPSTTENSVITGGTFTSDDIVWDRDDVNSVSVPFSPWSASITYGDGADNIVTGSDGNYYVSIVGSNLNNDPISSPSEWQPISFFFGSTAGVTRLEQIGALTPTNQHVIVGDGSAWTTSLFPGLVPNFLGGLNTSNSSGDADHDITVAAGRCNDSTNALSMALSSARTKRIDATYAAGDSNGGLASGASLTNATWYHIFVVSIGGVIDVMFDTSVTCANGVANNAVSNFRRIGSIKTDGSANIVPYLQSGDEFTWSVTVQDAADTNPTETAVSKTLNVPLGVSTVAKFYGAVTSSDAATACVALFTSLSQTDTAPSATTFHIRTEIQSAAQTFGQLFYVASNASSQVRYRVNMITGSTTTAITVIINTVGWIDSRGK